MTKNYKGKLELKFNVEAENEIEAKKKINEVLKSMVESGQIHKSIKVEFVPETDEKKELLEYIQDPVGFGDPDWKNK